MQTLKLNNAQRKPDFSFGKSFFRSFSEGVEREWVISNGIGGYANLTIIGSNSRTFSGLLSTSFNPPTDRFTCLANVVEQIQFNGDTKTTVVDLRTNHMISETMEGQKYLTHFTYDSYPTFSYQISDCLIDKEIGMVYGENAVVICYTVKNGRTPVTLNITPEFTYKPLGSILFPNELNFDVETENTKIVLTPLKDTSKKIYFESSEGKLIKRSTYPTSMAVPTHEIVEGVLYDLDTRNGLNCTDSYYTPYDVTIEIAPFETKKFYMVCSTSGKSYNGFTVLNDMQERKESLSSQLPVQDDLTKCLCYSSDHFIVARKSTNCKTILAGLPWFLDWGRDTMIAFTGLSLCTHRFEDAESILLSFAAYVKDGLLPNVFPDTSKELPRYNTMDASLWYFYAVYQYLKYNNTDHAKEFIQEKIYPVLEQIIHYYKIGTDFSIHMDDDYLISGGSDLDQITWMDVRVGDWVVTPRHGKPVEINALWYNALCVMAEISEDSKAIEYRNFAQKVKKSFIEKFWNEKENCLYDVISKNKDGIEEKDPSIRPNQLYAVSLPFSILPEEKEKAIVDKAFEILYTPLGIRSLAPDSVGYHEAYIGKLIDRDSAYHMGTSWGYITGAFISAYLKVNHHSKEALSIGKQLLAPMVDHLNDGCLGGVAEVFDGSFPCTSRGCYTQAWSVGELLRAYTEDILPYEK